MKEYTYMIMLDDGSEIEITVYAVDSFVGSSHAFQEAKECGLRPVSSELIRVGSETFY